MRAQYEEREVVGGVYLIRNAHSNKLLLESTTDLRSSANRFTFSQKTGSCVYLKLQQDWTAQGGKGFTFEVLEELRKEKTLTESAYKADLDLMLSLWRERLSNENLYT